MNQTIQTIIAVVVVTVILTLWDLKKKQSSWEGTVLDKNHVEADEDGAEQFIVVFQTDAGKKVSITVFEKDFNKFNKGDRVKKKAGEYFPDKI